MAVDHDQYQLTLEYQMNKFLSDLHIFKVKVHNLHWNLKGDNFFVVHPLFDEVMEEIDGFIDQIAEEIRMHGKMPFASLKTFLAHTVIAEIDSKYYSCDEAVKIVHDDFKLLLAEVHKLMKICEEKDEQEILNLLTDIGYKYQKHIWMYGAYLQK